MSSEASSQTAVQKGVKPDTTRKSILKLKDDSGIPWESQQKAPLFLDKPSNIKSTVIYDPDKNEYILYEKIGALDYRTPVHMSPEEFRKYEYAKAMRDYWQSRISGAQAGFKSNLIPQIEVGGAAFDKIFGSNTINIIPQGSAELIFGINISKTENPTLPVKLQLIPTFLRSLVVTSTNFDSIITCSVALSSCVMIGRIRFNRDGRSVMTRELLRASTTILPPAALSTSEETIGRISAARA